MKQVVVALLILSSLTFAHADSDSPAITRYGQQPKTSDVIQFPKDENSSLEAWEIVKDWAKGTYLNYSRFPWGEASYNGQSTYVCYGSEKGSKYAGVSENPERLKQALATVIKDDAGKPAADFTVVLLRCKTYSELVQANPSFSNLRKFFASIK